MKLGGMRVSDTGNTPQNDQQAQKKGNPSEFVKGALGAVAVLLLIGVVLVVLHETGIIRYPWEPTPIANVGGQIREGTIDASTEQRQADTSMVNVKLGASPKFDRGDAEGSITIINAAENRRILRVEIRLNETGELLFDSGMMNPNTYIDGGTLAVNLPKGEYPATATVFTYELDDPGEPMSATNFAQMITILN